MKTKCKRNKENINLESDERRKIRVIYNHVEKNIFATHFKHKIKDNISISKFLPILLRNPEELESQIICLNLHKVVKDFLKNNKKKFFEVIKDESKKIDFLLSIKLSKEYEYRLAHILEMCLENEKTIEVLNICYKLHKELKLYVKESGRTDKMKLINDCLLSTLASKIVRSYIKNLIIIEVKEWDLIDNMLLKYYCLREKKEFLQDYREKFIENYMNLFNKLMFSGDGIIGIYGNDRNYKDLTILHESTPEVKKALKNIILIDEHIQKDEDYLPLQFLMEILNGSRFSNARTDCINYITGLEFMLTKQPTTQKEKGVTRQFIDNIFSCYQYLGLSITKKEIKIIYNYRSNLVHGNFDGAKLELNKLEKLDYYKFEINKELGVDDSVWVLSLRLNEIFTNVYKLYCTNHNYVESLKYSN